MTQRGRHAARNARIPGRRASHERNRTKTKTGRSCQTASRKTVLNQRFSTRLIGWKDEFGLELCIARADDVGRARGIAIGESVERRAMQRACKRQRTAVRGAVIERASRSLARAPMASGRWAGGIAKTERESHAACRQQQPPRPVCARRGESQSAGAGTQSRALSGSLPETFRHGTAPRRAAVSIVVAVVRKHDATYNRDVMRNNNRVTAHVKATAHPKLA